MLGLVLPMAAGAAFNSVSLTSGTTLRTTVGSSTIDLTVTSGTIESVTVNAGSIDLTLAAGSAIDLTSAGKLTFTYNVNSIRASFTCGSSTSVLSLSMPTSGATETTTITPVNTICVAPGSVSSGGGSSSSSSSSSTTSTTSSASSASPTTTTTTTTTAAPKTTTTTTTTAKPTTPVVTAPVVAPVVSAPVSVSMAPVLTKEINPGARSDEVMKLQELLAQDPSVYPDGIVSGYYGPKTVAAVRKFQAKHGLPVVGRVGPSTLAKINEVLGSPVARVAAPTAPSVQSQTANQIQSQIQAIQQQIQGITGAVVSVPSAPAVSGGFTSALSVGSRNESVKVLQQVLNSDPDTSIASSGVGSTGRETIYFGPATQAAVQKFQVKYGLAGPGDPGYGFVGPATRAKLNEVSGGVSSTPAPSYAPTAPAPVAPAPASQAPASTSGTAKQIEDQIKAIRAQIKAFTPTPAATPAPVVSPAPASTSQIEDQIKVIQAQIEALLKK